jgi:hypothetical protein
VTAPVPEVEEAPEIEGGFSRRALGWIVGGTVASFLAFVLLGVYGKDLDRRPTPQANTFSYSALGHHGLASFLVSMGLGVLPRQAPAGGVGPGRPLILAEPDGRDPERLKALREEARDRGARLVLVLPKWSPGPARKDRPDWLDRVSLMPGREVERVVRELGDEGLRKVTVERLDEPLRCTAAWGSSTAGMRIDVAPQLLAPSPELDPVVSCSGGYLIARRAGAAGPATYLISDPDLLNNQGLGQDGNAEAVYRFLTHDLAATSVVFDETIHGFNRVPGLLAEALRFPMVLAVLQSVLLLGVVLWAGMGRFGKPLPAAAGIEAGKEVLIDNTAKLLASGGHAADSLLLYFRQTTRAVAAHYFLPPDLPESERLARLQRLTDGHRQELNLAALERGIQRLPAGRRGEEQAARLAGRLHEWRGQMTGGKMTGTNANRPDSSAS